MRTFKTPAKHTFEIECSEYQHEIIQELINSDLLTYCPHYEVLNLQYCGHGDYMGSTVERSNFEVLMNDQDFPFLSRTCYGYGYEVAGIPVDEVKDLSDDEIELLNETMGALSNYPVIDDEHVGIVPFLTFHT